MTNQTRKELKIPASSSIEFPVEGMVRFYEAIRNEFRVVLFGHVRPVSTRIRASNGAQSPKPCGVFVTTEYLRMLVYLVRSWACVPRGDRYSSVRLEFDDPIREERTTTCTSAFNHWYLDYSVEERSTTCTRLHSQNV